MCVVMGRVRMWEQRTLQAGPPPRSETSTGGTPEAEEKNMTGGRKGEREERMEEERYTAER